MTRNFHVAELLIIVLACLPIVLLFRSAWQAAEYSWQVGIALSRVVALVIVFFGRRSSAVTHTLGGTISPCGN